MQTTIEQAARLFLEQDNILVITGAGISADSGLPTYRGVGGLYNTGQTEEGYAIEDILSIEMFERRPELTWKYLLELEKSSRGRRPNAAHEALAYLEKKKKRLWVLTQNVDGFHHMAGSEKLVEIHGNLHRLSCTVCEHEEERDDYIGLELPPACPQCAGLIRPQVTLFGEALPYEATRVYEREMNRGFDCVVVIGTSAVFPYIYGPVVEAARHGIPTLEINPDRTELSKIVRHFLPGKAAESMLAIRRIFEEANS